MKYVAVAALPKLALPLVKLPVIDKLDNIPTEVMFGCAFVYTVPAISAFAT